MPLGCNGERMGRLLVFGTSHTVAPARLRDGLYMNEEAVRGFLDSLAGDDAFREAVLLHTCTRLEVYAIVDDPEAAETRIIDLLAAGDMALEDEIRSHSYAFTDTPAARHLLRVAAGLDSIVLGESQILGQVRAAADIAAKCGTLGSVLGRLFQAGVRTGKRTRAETNLNLGPTSLAAAAVRLALDASTDFPTQHVLVLGAGETARLVARHVAKRRPAQLVIANRSPEPAERLAAELGAEAAGLDDLADLIRTATVMIAATAASEPILSARDLEELMSARAGLPLVVVDLGRPRNVEAPDVQLPGLTVHDLDGLASVVESNRELQAAEIPLVDRIVDEQLETYLAWRRSRDVLPHVLALREHFFDTGRRELEAFERRFGQDQRETLEAYTRGLLSKLLHEPTVHIKRTDRDTAEGLATLEAVESLFDLDV